MPGNASIWAAVAALRSTGCESDGAAVAAFADLAFFALGSRLEERTESTRPSCRSSAEISVGGGGGMRARHTRTPVPESATNARKSKPFRSFGVGMRKESHT